jgi:PAS domain S-box-containing protein
MKRGLTIKSRLFFAIAAILACSYALLFFTTLATMQHFIDEQAENDLASSLKYAKTQFNARQEQALEALKLPAASDSVHKLFHVADHGGIKNAVDLWAKSLDSLEVLTVFDARRNVLARNSARKEPESFLSIELLHKVSERKQPLITTEVVAHDKYCLEVSSSVCQSLPENSEVMVQLVLLPVIDREEKVIGLIVAGGNVNNSQHLSYQQQKVFGKAIEMLVTLKGEIVASSMTDSGGFLLALEAKVLQTLKKGYSFHGATALNGRAFEMHAEPILNHSGEFIGSIAVVLSMDRYKGLRNDNYRNLVLCGLFSGALIFMLAYVTAWKFTAPIRRFAHAVKTIAAGDYSVRISESDSIEFSTLTEAFNRMSESLHDRDAVIMSQNAELMAMNEQHVQRASEREIQLEAKAGIQKTILKNLVDGLIVADDRQLIIEMNPAAEKLLGVKAAEMIGGPMAKLYDLPGLSALAKLAHGGGGDDSSEQEAVLVLKLKNRLFRFALIDLRFEDGASRGILLGVRDITADREVDRLKSGFIAKVSHELKTPLTSMKGSLQFILKKGKWLTGVEREMLTVCFRNTERLIGLVAGIIELSKIEAGTADFSMRPLQMGEVVLYAVEEMKSAALAKNTALINDVPMDLPRVYGDYERLLQVLLNLLSNAVKFSPENSVVLIQAAVEGSYLKISVADNGHGIPEEETVTLFTRFQQMGRPEDGGFSGGGLGLAICREIIEKHGGSIYYEPSADGGNLFAFRLPLNGAIDGQ